MNSFSLLFWFLRIKQAAMIAQIVTTNVINSRLTKQERIMTSWVCSSLSGPMGEVAFSFGNKVVDMVTTADSSVNTADATVIWIFEDIIDASEGRECDGRILPVAIGLSEWRTDVTDSKLLEGKGSPEVTDEEVVDCVDDSIDDCDNKMENSTDNDEDDERGSVDDKNDADERGSDDESDEEIRSNDEGDEEIGSDDEGDEEIGSDDEGDEEIGSDDEGDEERGIGGECVKDDERDCTGDGDAVGVIVSIKELSVCTVEL